jgi:hypothetical protein
MDEWVGMRPRGYLELEVEELGDAVGENALTQRVSGYGDEHQERRHSVNNQETSIFRVPVCAIFSYSDNAIQVSS